MARAEIVRCSDGAASGKAALRQGPAQFLRRQIGVEILRRHGRVAQIARGMHRHAARSAVETQFRGLQSHHALALAERWRAASVKAAETGRLRTSLRSPSSSSAP